MNAAQVRSGLAASEVTYRTGGATLVDRVSLEVREGELLALVGPNGAGKSTLLRLLAGDLKPSAGSVTCDGIGLDEWKQGKLARRRAVLTQDNQVAFPFRVAEVVAMGRSPWRGTAKEDDDVEAIASAMERTDVTHLAERSYTSLSGGERARVALARVLAQATPIVLLDEPTAALDLRHQEDVLGLASDLAMGGAAVAVVVHDLSLAAAYADRIAMMSGGALVAAGTPNEVLTPAALQQVYGIGVRVVDDQAGLLIVPERGERGERTRGA